ncbi:MAG TPA: glycerophosphodiester phosphodiesterase [Solirubrobacteraceae bacterium]|nr:glycerophosphodiester phosphodiesterase [Solirubrobacteraceae bacterium]
MRRIGHKGADHIAPGNTPESFDAALAHGVDMIEFDVLPEDHEDREGSPLRLAHDYTHDLAHAPTLEEGLAHLAGDAFGAVELDVDLKLPGYEGRVVDALRSFGLVHRSLVTTQYMRSLVKLREIEPELRLGWSVPRVKRDYTKSLLYAVPAYSFLLYARRRLPGVAAGHIAAGRCDAVMCHYKLVTSALLEAVRDAGGELYVWTVDDARRIRSLEALGVTGVITNDPRLFDYAIEQVAAE